MTAVPTDDRFTAGQRAALERIEAAPDAEESLRERVARAICHEDAGVEGYQWHEAPWLRDSYRRMADAAIAVIAGTR